MARIRREEEKYVRVPKFYTFENDRDKEVILNRNFAKVNAEVDCVICEILGKAPSEALKQVIARENLRVPYLNNTPSFDVSEIRNN